MTSDQDFETTIDPSYGAEVEKQTLSVWALTALVVGSMVGAGIFTLPAAFGREHPTFDETVNWQVAH
jgi:arginine:ornithine antiporter/lysine permease